MIVRSQCLKLIPDIETRSYVLDRMKEQGVEILGRLATPKHPRWPEP